MRQQTNHATRVRARASSSSFRSDVRAIHTAVSRPEVVSQKPCGQTSDHPPPNHRNRTGRDHRKRVIHKLLPAAQSTCPWRFQAGAVRQRAPTSAENPNADDRVHTLGTHHRAFVAACCGGLGESTGRPRHKPLDVAPLRRAASPRVISRRVRAHTASRDRADNEPPPNPRSLRAGQEFERARRWPRRRRRAAERISRRALASFSGTGRLPLLVVHMGARAFSIGWLATLVALGAKTSDFRSSLQRRGVRLRLTHGSFTEVPTLATRIRAHGLGGARPPRAPNVSYFLTQAVQDAGWPRRDRARRLRTGRPRRCRQGVRAAVGGQGPTSRAIPRPRLLAFANSNAGVDAIAEIHGQAWGAREHTEPLRRDHGSRCSACSFMVSFKSSSTEQ